MSPPMRPVVVQYLYVHEPDEGFWYPTVRAGRSAAEVACRYLECALTQVATLALRDLDCELVLATNVEDPSRLGRPGEALLARIAELGTRVVPTRYAHRPPPGTAVYVSSRYVLDAVLSAVEGLDPGRELWLTDLDCVWADPERVFAAAPPPGEIGCVRIDYPPDWDTVGFEVYGRTRLAIGELAREMGAEAVAPPWVGGELLAGTVDALRDMVRACEELDARLERDGKTLPNEEQILSLAGAVERIRFRDLSNVARRMTTGPRSYADRVANPEQIGLWHLPAEKGLSLRRTARQVLAGRTGPLRRDLEDPRRMARRFNVGRPSTFRRLRDDSWIAAQRLRAIASGATA